MLTFYILPMILCLIFVLITWSSTTFLKLIGVYTWNDMVMLIVLSFLPFVNISLCLGFFGEVLRVLLSKHKPNHIE